MEIVDVKVPSSLSLTLDDDECKKPNANDDDEWDAFVTPSFENYTTSIGFWLMKKWDILEEDLGRMDKELCLLLTL